MKALQAMGLLSLSSLVAMSTEVPATGITDVVEAGNTVRKPHVQQRVTVLKRLVNHRVGCVLPDRCHKVLGQCACHFWQPAVSADTARRVWHTALLRAIVGR